MSNPVDATLQNAFDLIEQGQLEDARNLLEPLLESENNNPAVWWVYAHAVENPEDGHRALDKVLQLDPTYPGASDLKTHINASQTIPEESSDVDDWDDLSFEPDNEFADSDVSSRSPIRFIGLALLVIVIVVGIFALLSGVFGSTPTPTEVANQTTTEIPTTGAQIAVSSTVVSEPTEVSPTEEVLPTETLEEPTDVPPTATDEEPTAEPTEEDVPTEEVLPTETLEEPTDVPPTATTEASATPSFVNSLIEGLSDYEIQESDIETRTTLLGETLDVSVCAAPGPEFSLTLNGIMDTLVEANSEIPSNIEAMAVSLIDCDNEVQTKRTIGVERTQVIALANDEIELKDFQRTWQPLP